MNNFISKVSNDQTVQQNSLSLSGNQWTAYTSESEQSRNTVISNALQG